MSQTSSLSLIKTSTDNIMGVSRGLMDKHTTSVQSDTIGLYHAISGGSANGGGNSHKPQHKRSKSVVMDSGYNRPLLRARTKVISKSNLPTSLVYLFFSLFFIFLFFYFFIFFFYYFFFKIY